MGDVCGEYDGFSFMGHPDVRAYHRFRGYLSPTGGTGGGFVRAPERDYSVANLPEITVGTHHVIRAEKGGDAYIEGTYHLWLDDGHVITNNESHWDQRYGHGWREYIDIAKGVVK